MGSNRDVGLGEGKAGQMGSNRDVVGLGEGNAGQSTGLDACSVLVLTLCCSRFQFLHILTRKPTTPCTQAWQPLVMTAKGGWGERGKTSWPKEF